MTKAINKNISTLRRPLLTLLVFATLIVSINLSGRSNAATSLEQKKWLLKSIELNNKTYKGPHLGFIKFENGNIEGQSTCNSYSGVYNLKNQNKLEIYRIGLTQLLCNIDNKMQIEADYIEALEQTTAFKLENDTLILLRHDTAKNKKIRFATFALK